MTALRRRAPLFVRILALALIASVPPIAALGVSLYDRNSAALRTVTRELHLAIAADARRAVRSDLSRGQEELTAVAQLLLAPGLGDDNARLALMGNRVTASAILDSVSVFTAAGARALTVKAKDVQAELPQPPPRAALAAPPNKLFAGEPRLGKQGPELPVWLPAGAGEQRVLVGASLRLSGLCWLLGQLGETRLGARDALRVVDGDDKLTLAADPALIGRALSGKDIFSSIAGRPSFRNEFGTAIEFSENGTQYLGALETIPELGWAVVTRQPRAQAYASLEAMRRAVLVAGWVAALVAVAGGALLARTLVKPIRALAQAARRVGERKFEGAPASVSARSDELGDLGRSFDAMVHDLDASEKQLLSETRARDSLSRYLSSDIVELILKNPDKLRLGGERREVTVLFADVCAFTRLSESQPPEVVVAILNELFTFATEIVQRRGGIIDKFIGDCVMAVWGTPETRPDDALRAVLAAEDLRRWVETANRKWRAKFGVAIELAMGVNTGPAVAGNIGSEKRMEYTVIGDAVNVAARLEAMAQPNQILVSEATRARVGDEVALRALGESALHGRKQTTAVFEVQE